MARRLFSAVVIALATLASPNLAWAQAAPAATAQVVDPKAAQAFIKQLSDKAFGVLRDKSLTPATREARFRELLRQGFALDKVSSAVLGKNRRTATPAQLAAFNEAFPDYVIRIYASRLTDFSDTSITVQDSVPAGSRGDVSVRSKVSGKSLQQPVKADWRVTQIAGQGLRIIDLSFEGISQVATQRDEFDARIASKGLDALIADLKSQKGGSAAAAKARN
jgi:phospholipid transport system substrate-binding protein